MQKVALLFIVMVFAALFSACNPLEQKKKSGLQVITNDIPSTLFLDGQYLDKTPYINKEIQPGTYTLRIEPDDPAYTPYETTITLQKGLLSVVIWKPGTRPEVSGGVIYEMEKLKSNKNTELSIVTIPDSAIVTIDQQPKDFAPLIRTDIQPGQHEFEVTLPSYETQKHTINMVEGHRVNVTVKLAKNSENGLPLTATPSAGITPSPTPTTNSLPVVAGARGASPSAGATRSSVAGARVKILPTNFMQDGKEVVRVRDAASNGGKELGFAEVGQEYSYLDETSNGWYKISFNGQTGWVTGQFSQLINE